MATLDAKTIAGVATNAGFSGEDLVVAVAIAFAESSGNTHAHNGNAGTGDNSYGLWQINMLGSMGPARRRQFDISKNEDLYQPNTNASAAYKLYKSRGSFKDWSTYNNGSYKTHLNKARKGAKDNNGAAVAMGTVEGGTGTGTGFSIGGLDVGIPGIPDIGGAITGAFNAFGRNLFKLGMNAGGLIVAAIFLIIGMVILMRDPLSKTAKTVAGVAGPGKVAKVAGKVGRTL